MENLKMKILLFVLCYGSIYANELGSITGVINDLENKEPLIGANVIISGTANGAATDFEGKFFITGVKPGMISLKVSYIGYETKTVRGIEIFPNQTINKNIGLKKDVVSITGVQVMAEKKTGSDIESLSKKQDALEMQDNISFDQISKSGDSHVADAVRRVTGVTIVEDKFLIVRGLGDRYSSAQLNSVGMPSPESDTRSVPLDLFSTALISGIDVAKSYRPDLPGAFGGGNVNIRTKLYPSKTIYKLKVGTGVSGNIFPGDDMKVNMSGSNDFFTQTDYKGAFSSDSNWLEGWSYLSVAEVLSTDNDKSSIIAQELKLHGNYPNPFNPSTKISFELSGYHDNVTFTVFNVMGQIVNEISFSNTLPGMQVISWNGINSNGASVPSGIYFYQVQAGDLSAMGKMSLVK